MFRVTSWLRVGLWSLSIAAAAPLEAQPTIYVRALPAAAHPDGQSWATAYTSLSTAIAAANALPRSAASPVAIYLASGTYVPTTTGSDRASATFAPGSWVDIFGGFNAANPEADPDHQSDSTPLPVLIMGAGALGFAVVVRKRRSGVVSLA